MPESHIIALLIERNEDAIPALADQYSLRLFRLTSNILTNEADVQECINDTYLAIWNAIPPERPASLSAYVLRICKNIAITMIAIPVLRGNLSNKNTEPTHSTTSSSQ